MTRHVLDVGQCNPDHVSISRMLKEHFDVEIVRTHLPSDTLAALQDRDFDLVLINRKLDQDYSDGMNIVRSIKSDASLSQTPVMLVSNYPEAHETAMSAGAIYGFGKAELGSPDVIERLSAVLGDD